MKIKAKILLPLIILTILVASAILISNVFLFSGYVDTSAASSVDAASMVSQDSLRLLTEDAELSARFIAEIDAVRTAVAEQNREEILSLTTGLQNELELDFCTITDATGTVIARTHEPDNFGDSVVTQTNVKSAMDGNRVSGLETGTAVPLAVRSGCPIYDFDGNIVGVISAGYRLDYMDFVDNEKRLTGCETAIFVGDVRVSTTITETDGKRLIGVKADPQVSDTVLKGNRSVGEIVINGRSAFASYYPLTAINGSIVGMLSTAQYTDTATGTIMSFLQSGLLITLLMLALSITVMLFIVSRIVSPIHNMVKTATALAGGDNTVDVTVNTKDEMRSLADAFNNMIDKNNDVFSSITLSANQVTSGSQQIASSSQSLAQGAMDQAAAIKQLSSSMQEISDRTKSNVETAKKAAALADAVKSNAEKGSHQMDEMMIAVKQIHDASQSISKVINTIDDIAFQTNILALNAAVEAARAGTHGKGFAVVAEEVRNLAAKSAEAASNTEDLIANSMEKAEVGVRIASETSTSLMDIVSGINESTSLVMEIAESSEQQSFGISEINTGIEQVAQVVQHNSATAEQSSAAAAEMNDQSLTLQQLVSQFKLKNSGVPGLPGSGARDGGNRSSEARRLA